MCPCRLQGEFRKINDDVDLNRPKMWMLRDIAETLRSFGNLRYCNTSNGESRHRDIKMLDEMTNNDSSTALQQVRWGCRARHGAGGQPARWERARALRVGAGSPCTV